MRRDILESLREVILFMQGYEKFRKLQEEKIAIFNQLKNDVKELNQMIDSRLRKYFPKGKLKPLIDPHQFTLATVHEAHALLESGKAHGKIVLSIE